MKRFNCKICILLLIAFSLQTFMVTSGCLRCTGYFHEGAVAEVKFNNFNHSSDDINAFLASENVSAMIANL